MELSEFKGEYTLDAVDYAHTFEQYGLEYANSISFRLNGRTYTAVEDPRDGYRSSMSDIFVDEVTITKNVFTPVQVRASYVHDDDTDILYLADVQTGEVVIEVGTTNCDGDYPSFVSNFNPAAMIVNKPDGWTRGCIGEYSYDELIGLMGKFILCGALNQRWPTQYNFYRAITAFTNTPGDTLTIGKGIVPLPDHIHEYMPPVHKASKLCNLSVHGMGNGQLQKVFYQLNMYKTNLRLLDWYLCAHNEHANIGLSALLAAMMSVVPHQRITFKRIQTEDNLNWLTSLVGQFYNGLGPEGDPFILKLPSKYTAQWFIEFASSDKPLEDYAVDLIQEDFPQMSHDDLAAAFLETDLGTWMKIEKAMLARLTPIIRAARAFYNGETAPEKDLANWQRLVQLILLHDRTALLKGANDIIALSTVPNGTVGYLL